MRIELKNLATKEEFKGLLADLYTDLHKVRAALIQAQLTSTAIILVGIGLMLHFKI